ncbi:BZ3500_MvSof-1268-A1-R1_Chr7-3g09632 [Microbotryum saponariae]|uniref:Exosome complex protein n=1 Tax=Microbotryum saponariae TaxID=289078 RepID=A0A2X0KUQ1_9BASI|nr:BZ3501_MvSof-1269-A2-R1_Chr7-2g09355 [Microbotryum saponariae]SDA02314.1 BZ3500_MvSof-1268-A1-R1_Chr7-3g09632 [Microbotryum saponariae]
MSLTEVDPSKTLETLSTTVDELEATLAPLLSSCTSLTDLFAQLETQERGVSPIERAHARIMLAYTVHDLIWVYLRICAIDPATHPVMAELTRLKNYFSKLHRAEPTILQTNQTQTGNEAGPSTISINDNGQRTNLDIDAATRFINAAIGGKKKLDPKGKHTRFDGEKGEEDGGSSSASSEQEVAKSLGKKEGKTEAKKQVKKVPIGRPKMDPFMGFDDQTTSSKPNQREAKLKGKPVEATPTTTSSEGKKKKRALSVSDVEPTPTSTSTAPLSKHQKKKLKLKAGGGLPGEGVGSGSKDGEGKKQSLQKVKKATKE